MGRYYRRVIFVVMISVLPACGLIDEHLTLHYKSFETPVEVVKEKHLLSVDVVDSRKNKEVVGTYCGDMHLYLVRDSVADLVKDALSAEFARRGYALGEGSVVVKINLTEFFFSHCGGSPLVSHPRDEARVAFEVQLYGIDGVSVYENTVYGGDSPQPSFWSGVSAEDALEDALSNSIVRLFDDQSFQKAILKASRN